jgi:hypothetical protein
MKASQIRLIYGLSVFGNAFKKPGGFNMNSPGRIPGKYEQIMSNPVRVEYSTPLVFMKSLYSPAVMHIQPSGLH